MQVERDTVAAALDGAYTLEHELGRGGMATVYLALDRKHGRQVALKMLHPELGAALGPERFRREIATAARLQHPHVLSVFDSGEAAGRLWFTMPYVEGESLRERLTRERQLPLDEAVRIAREAAQGLHYAHRHGVVHRDVKPENILLTEDGTTLVADFGIARALAGAAGAPDGAERLTGTGLAVGTPAYMAPEQAAGDRDVDARADVYALGTVLYEMLAGEPPFTGPTPQAVIAKRMATPAPSARVVRPAIPPALDAALARALATAPADRHPTAAAFAAALGAAVGGADPGAATPNAAPAPNAAARREAPARRRAAVVAAGTVLLVAAGGAAWWRRAREVTAVPAVAAAPAVSGAITLAVLPFENLGDSSDAYFADGVTDAIRGKLTAIPGLQVVARASSNQYRGASARVQQVARELGVQYVLTGTVRWAKGPNGASRVQVSPELIRAATDAAAWAEPFDAPVTDVFAVQASVAGRVAQALDVQLGAGERAHLAERPTADLAAYDAYLQGEAVSNAAGASDPATLRRAIALYARATAIDPTFARAWARVSEARSLLYFNAGATGDTAALGPSARAAAERALALAPNGPDGRRALGAYYIRIALDPAAAAEQYAIALRAAPADAELLEGAAGTERARGQWDRAVSYLQRAAALDPRSATVAYRLGMTLLWARRYPDARASLDRALALAPANPGFRETRAMVDLAQGDLAGARAVLRAAPAALDQVTLSAFVATYWDLAWVLDDLEQRRLLAAGPGVFERDQVTRFAVLTQLATTRGDAAAVRTYADSARAAAAGAVHRVPGEGQYHAFLGLALAHLGRRDEALREAARAVELRPVARDAYGGAYVQLLVARVHLALGESDAALDQLEPLLRRPMYLSPAWLRIDPTFAPLRGNARFERLAGGR